MASFEIPFVVGQTRIDLDERCVLFDDDVLLQRRQRAVPPAYAFRVAKKR